VSENEKGLYNKISINLEFILERINQRR